MDLPKGRQVGIMAQNIESIFPQLTKESEFDLNDDPENINVGLKIRIYLYNIASLSLSNIIVFFLGFPLYYTKRVLV